MGQVSYTLPTEQNKEWFIVVLLPHIRLPLSQQNIGTQDEALEIEIKLEASPIGDTHTRVKQIQTQLADLTLKLQDLKKGKDVR